MANFIELNERATKQHGLLTASQLLDAGFTDRMIRSRVAQGMLQRRHKGVVQLAGTAPSWHQDVLAAVLAASPNAVASHRTAARLWGMRTIDDEIELSITYPRKVSLSNVIVHRSRDLEIDDATIVAGITTTTPERTICDLGLIFPEHEVLRILRHAIATNLVLPRDLWRMRQRTSKQGRNGTGVLERVLQELPEQAALTESGLEVQLLEICERFGIEPPVPQLPVRVGGRNFRLDFAWTSKMVFVEVDVAAYHSAPAQIAADGFRQNLLVQAGWTPLRFTATDLRDRASQCANALKKVLGSVPENRP